MKKLKKASFLIVSSLVLTSCDTSSMSSSISDTIANALPNLWVCLAQLGAFIVMVFVVYKFLYKPIKMKLHARQDYIDSNIKESEKKMADAKEAKEVADNNIKASRIKANQIVEEAHQEAIADSNKVMADAQTQIDFKKQQFEKDLEERKQYLERQAHNEIVTTALDASKEILGRELTKDDNDKIVGDFIDQMKKDEAEKHQ